MDLLVFWGTREGGEDLETSRENGLNRSIGKFYLVIHHSY